MSKKSNNLLLIALTIVLIFIFTPIFGSLYKTYFGPISYGPFWGPSHPEYTGGLFMSYVFFVTILLVIMTNYSKKYLLLLLAIWPIIVSFMAGDGQAILSQILSFVIAFLIAQIILFTYKKVKK